MSHAKPKPIPEGYHSVTPYIAVQRSAEALEFYRRAFGAEIAHRLDGPGGVVVNAEMHIGDSIVQISEEMPQIGLVAPRPDAKGSTGSLVVYCPDVDALYSRAVAAGAAPVAPVEDKFHGDRTGTLLDPYGHRWVIATHTEEVSDEEMQRRVAAWMASKGAS